VGQPSPHPSLLSTICSCIVTGCCATPCRVGDADPVIQGLAAVLVGTCALAPSGPDMPAAGIAGWAAVLEAVAGQVGLGPLFSCIAGLRDTPAYAAAAVAQALPQPLTRASAAAAAVYASSDDEGTGAASLHLAGPVCSTLQCRLRAWLSPPPALCISHMLP